MSAFEDAFSPKVPGGAVQFPSAPSTLGHWYIQQTSIKYLPHARDWAGHLANRQPWSSRSCLAGVAGESLGISLAWQGTSEILAVLRTFCLSFSMAGINSSLVSLVDLLCLVSPACKAYIHSLIQQKYIKHIFHAKYCCGI